LCGLPSSCAARCGGVTRYRLTGWRGVDSDMTINTNFRSSLVFLFDLAAVLVAWVGAFSIRFNFDWPAGYERTIWLGLIPLLLAQLVACRWAGLYRGMWVFASLPDLKRVLKAVLVSAVVTMLST